MKRQGSYDGYSPDSSISKRMKGESETSNAVILPYDISSRLAMLSTCTQVHVVSEESKPSRLGDRFYDSGLSLTRECELVMELNSAGYYNARRRCSISGHYYQNFSKDYFKITKKIGFMRLFAPKSMVCEKLEENPTPRLRPTKKRTFAVRLKREKLRLYKFWLICQLQMIPPS